MATGHKAIYRTEPRRAKLDAMKRRTVPLSKQVADAEVSVVAQRGQPYLDGIYRSKGIEGKNNDLMGMLERLGVLNFELGKLSEAASLPAPSATTLSAPSAAVPAKQDGGSAAPPVSAPSGTMPAAEANLAKPSLETLRALAAELWPTESVQSFEAIERRLWFERLQVPGFDRAALDSKYGESRPMPNGRGRTLTAMAQAKVDSFFKTRVSFAPTLESAPAPAVASAPAPAIPDLPELRAIATAILPGRDYWGMSTAEIHKVLWQENLSVPGMDEKALSANYWRPAVNPNTTAKVVRVARQTRIEELLNKRLVW